MRELTDPLKKVGTLNEALEHRVESSTDSPWLTLYARDRVTDRLTFGELHDGALSWVGLLAASGVKPGCRVLLVLPTERSFFEAFWGILLAGGVPVPAYPPIRLGRIDEYVDTLRTLGNNCGASALVTNGRILPLIREVATLPEGEIPITLPGDAHGASPGTVARVSPESLGLLQYTSGSTGNQKGVMLTHANLLANLRAIGRGVGLTTDDVAVSWLPLYHDMGLIGLMLGSVYWGLPLVAASPIDFLRKPARWLRMLSDHGGTVSAAPNFAYSLAARKVRERDLEGIDLSRWRVALCGAEPIHPPTVNRFSKRYEACGFRPEAFFPAYGLAENTLAVSFSELDTKPKIVSFDQRRLETDGIAEPMAEQARGKSYVSVGKPLDTVEMGAVNDEGEFLGEGERGEIVVRGPSVMRGYFGNPDATASAIRNGWLRTGDLGFSFDGFWYVCGRSKDMVIKAGRNYFAEDIEAAGATVAGVRPGGVCVFSVADEERGTEEVVFVAEVRGEREGVADELRRTIVNATGCSPDRVLLVEPRTLSKTSSGKIQRFRACQWYLDGSLTTREGERRSASLWFYVKARLKDLFRQ